MIYRDTGSFIDRVDIFCPLRYFTKQPYYKKMHYIIETISYCPHYCIDIVHAGTWYLKVKTYDKDKNVHSFKMHTILTSKEFFANELTTLKHDTIKK